MNLGILTILWVNISKLVKGIKEIKEKENIENKIINSQPLSVQESYKLMEYLVSTYFAEWRIYNINPSSENYMTEDNQKDAIKYCIRRIMENMTDTVRSQLSIAFTMDTREDMIKSILNTAKLHIIEYSVRQNNYTIDNKHIPNVDTF